MYLQIVILYVTISNIQTIISVIKSIVVDFNMVTFNFLCVRGKKKCFFHQLLNSLDLIPADFGALYHLHLAW